MNFSSSHQWLPRLFLCGVALSTLAVAGRSGEVPNAESLSETPIAFSSDDLAFFERKIRPLLVEHCYECHSAESKTLQGGLRLDSRDLLLRGGDSGPAVVPGDLRNGTLLEAVRYSTFEMPPSGKLPAEQVKFLEDWVLRGAPMPQNEPDANAAPAAIDFESRKEFWSFRPLRTSTPPAASIEEDAVTSIDAFLITELARHGLAMSPPADRGTLIRRASFDLLGLPPTPDEVTRFVDDDAPDAYARLIDRLLASPHYGERWGRHWLDLARYSDATASWLSSLAQAWHYRDWVIRAVNEDLPYDDFVRRQLAADHLDDTEPADIAALGFLGLSPTYWKELKLDKEVIKGTVAEEWEERIDAIGRTFLGLTVACARCHDHKYDPIGTADYYAFAGVLASTRLIDRPVIPSDAFAVVEQARADVAALEAQIKQLEAAKPVPPEATAQIAQLRQRIDDITRSTPHYDTAPAHAVDDAALFVEADGADATKLTYKPGEAVDLPIQIRGNPSNLGPVVPRRFLTVLSKDSSAPFSVGSGRLELADAIVTDAAPLAARVIVNRVWSHHFGRGLVETLSDFGAQGARPTHPDLLDDLATRFIASGWSLKALHREIMLSAAYRQSSFSPAESEISNAPSIDPENRLLWRMARKRLEVEAWRDAILSATGSLDLRLNGPALELKNVENSRRTVYGRVDRYELDDMLRLYDFPDPLGHSPRREPTTTPLQQLFLLNSPFIKHQAERLAARLRREQPDDVTEQIELAYELLFSRPPTYDELRLGKEFLIDGAVEGTDDGWAQYAQVLLGSNELLFVD